MRLLTALFLCLSVVNLNASEPYKPEEPANKFIPNWEEYLPEEKIADIDAMMRRLLKKKKAYKSEGYVQRVLAQVKKELLEDEVAMYILAVFYPELATPEKDEEEDLKHELYKEYMEEFKGSHIQQKIIDRIEIYNKRSLERSIKKYIPLEKILPGNNSEIEELFPRKIIPGEYGESIKRFPGFSDFPALSDQKIVISDKHHPLNRKLAGDECNDYETLTKYMEILDYSKKVRKSRADAVEAISELFGKICEEDVQQIRDFADHMYRASRTEEAFVAFVSFYWATLNNLGKNTEAEVACYPFGNPRKMTKDISAGLRSRFNDFQILFRMQARPFGGEQQDPTPRERESQPMPQPQELPKKPNFL